MGFGADGTAWEKHLDMYAKHFRCLVIDNRGVGRSDQPAGPYSTQSMATDVIAVMDHAQVAKAKVVGISMGGAIAQELALNYPNRVSCMVLVSTWPYFNKYTTAVYNNLKNLRKTSRPEDFMALLQLWIFAPPFYEKNLDQLWAGRKAASENKKPQTQHGFEGQLDACITHNTVSRLGAVNIPTLITVGALDIFTPPRYSETLHKAIPNSRLDIYPDAGHVHHWESLDRFNQSTTEFLLNH